MKITNTNAPSVGLNPTTPETERTTGATGASFQGHPTILSFIEKQFEIAASEDSSSVISTARTLSGLGFTASANMRYAHFLEAYRKQRALAARYAERYPSCVFLPWDALHETRRILDLWVDLPEHYLGAVPSGQLPYLEIFELSESDYPIHHDWVPGLDMVDDVRLESNGELYVEETDPDDNYGVPTVPQYDVRWEAISRIALGLPVSECSGLLRHLETRERQDMIRRELRRLTPESRRAQDKHMLRDIDIDRTRISHTERSQLEQLGKEFQHSMFVVAPAEAFKTEVDWITRAQKCTTDVLEQLKTPPNDPLVIRMVKGGCLVIAAWGDEAAHINAIVRTITKNDKK